MKAFVVKVIAADTSTAHILNGVAPFVGADATRLSILTPFPAGMLRLPSTMR